MQKHHHQEHGAADEHFPTDIAGLVEAVGSEVVDLGDGDEVELRIAPVTKRIGDSTVRMLAYNGSIPGPTLRVREGSELVVNVANEADLDATVHWHGLRLVRAVVAVVESQPVPVHRWVEVSFVGDIAHGLGAFPHAQRRAWDRSVVREHPHGRIADSLRDWR